MTGRTGGGATRVRACVRGKEMTAVLVHNGIEMTTAAASDDYGMIQRYFDEFSATKKERRARLVL